MSDFITDIPETTNIDSELIIFVSDSDTFCVDTDCLYVRLRNISDSQNTSDL